ncbi:uncharacterized protein erich1 [Leuresthes tenuis]|uniref:uncharacterized protein erich1 n=1 Tax=Leuresthes tenuis TaxID=355514 RepID=UPI003B507283
MSHRKEAFQSKVLQKLYPATSTPAKDRNPPAVVDIKARRTHVKRKTSGDDTVFGGERNSPCRRMYTVLPPPPEYNLHSEKSVTLPQPESINSAEDPAEESVHESNEELEKEVEEQKRRRRRKRKPAPARDSGKHGAALSESSTGQSRVPVDEESERLSKNKRRKLKKKRHKEKMMSMGLLPRAAALEFTYHKDGEEKEEEEEEEYNERRVAELSDFLRTTTEIYMSDTSLREIKAPHLSATVDDLLGSISRGCKPCSVLKQLCCLKALAQRSETDGLEKALDELNHNPSMSAEETTAIVSLFKYWIRDILPMQRSQESRLSTVHP